jgi:hypothetical protein
VVTEEVEVVDLEAVPTEEPEASVEVVTEKVELADLEAVAVAHTEDSLEVVDLEAPIVALMQEVVGLEAVVLTEEAVA